MSDYGAQLIYGPGMKVIIPMRMIPANEKEQDYALDKQLQGTPLENLSELAGRVCYDSLGQGRGSMEYHAHILEVGHLSVYEHCAITIRVGIRDTEARYSILIDLIGRPGVWVSMDDVYLFITFNPRVVLDWDKIRDTYNKFSHIWATMATAMMEVMPCFNSLIPENSFFLKHEIVAVDDPDHLWLSFYMYGSRGWSHEMVRHGDFSAISQRSTRYVDESESCYVMHPLLEKYLESLDETRKFEANFFLDESVENDQGTYRALVSQLKEYLILNGVSGLNSIKQARGAARGYLGNALQTQLIFSASISQWQRMIEARCSEAADGEISCIFKDVVRELQASKYGGWFDKYRLEETNLGSWKVVTV